MLNPLDRAISWFAPIYGAKRGAARLRLEAYNTQDSRLRRMARSMSGPNTAVRGAIALLRNQARAFEENSDLAKRTLDLLEQNIVGTGIVPEPMIRDDAGKLMVDLNRAIARRLRDWRRRPEASHRHSDAIAKRLAARSFFRDGEVLLQHIRGTQPAFTHANDLPYSYELIESDRLPLDLDASIAGDRGGNIINGIAVNNWGEPQAYFLLPFAVEQGLAGAPNLGNVNPIRKDAADIIHAAAVKRIGQLRGASLFATVMSRLEDVNQVDEAERIAIRIASSMAYAVYDEMAPRPAAGDVESAPMTEIVPGQILNLSSADSKVEAIESKRPNDQMMPWRASQLRAMAGGVGVTASALMNEYLGTYSSQRQELVEGYASYAVLWSTWVDLVEEPMYRECIDALRLVDAEIRKGLGAADDRTVYDAEFSQPAMPWVDPQKEAQGLQLMYELGIQSKSSMIRARGGVPEETFEQIAEEKRADAKLALETAPPPAPGAQPGQQQQQDGAQPPAKPAKGAAA